MQLVKWNRNGLRNGIEGIRKKTKFKLNLMNIKSISHGRGTDCGVSKRDNKFSGLRSTFRF